MKEFNNIGSVVARDIVHLPGNKDIYDITAVGDEIIYTTKDGLRKYIVSNSIEQFKFKTALVDGAVTTFNWDTMYSDVGPQKNCLAWKNKGMNSNGIYTIKPADSEFKVYCDMETDGGGWTLVVSANASSTTLNAVDAHNFIPKNSDVMNPTISGNEGISNYINETEWSDMMIYTRGYKVKGTNINKMNKSIKYYTEQSRPANNIIGSYVGVATADTLTLLNPSVPGDNVSVQANNVDNWKIGMGINVCGNDSNEQTWLHFGASYVPQGFATNRDNNGGNMKIDNGYGDDMAGQIYAWDGASILEQHWFVR